MSIKTKEEIIAIKLTNLKKHKINSNPKFINRIKLFQK